MKRLIAIAAFSAAALSAHAQEAKTIADAKTKAFQHGLAKEQADSKRQVEAWPNQYSQALKALDQKYQGAGNLDGMLSVRKEIDRFQQTKQVSEEAVAQAPKELADLQTKAARLLQAIEIARRNQIRALADNYIVGLDELKKDLTRKGQFDDAIKVNEAIGLVRETAKAAIDDPAYQNSVSETAARAAEVPATDSEPGAEVKPAATAASNPKESAAQPTKKAPFPIGKWSSHPPDDPGLSLTMILHEDGRFELEGDEAGWGGTFKFLNDERTKVERTCKNGNVFILEYDPETDTMTQNDGAPYRRIEE